MKSQDIAVIHERTDVALATAPNPDEQRRLLKQLLASENLTDAEFDLFAEVCRRTNMDPFRRQIYAIKRRSRERIGGEWTDTYKMTIVFAIGGLQAQARRDGLAGREKTIYTYAENDERRKWPRSAEVTVYRRDPRTGEKDSYTAEVFFSEFCQFKTEQQRDGSEKQVPSGKWATMPHAMLSKCAEAAALRMGFPESLSGMHVQEEFDRDAPAQVTTSRPALRGRARSLDDVLAPQEAETTVVPDHEHDAPHEGGEAYDTDEAYGPDE